MSGFVQERWVDFGKRSGLRVRPVSIGAMRLPEDEEAAVRLMRKAIDAGMIYIDTCRGYADSEVKVGKSLKDGYREKVILSTKWSPWIKKVEEGDDASADCVYRRIVESLGRLDVEYVDFYQVWNVHRPEYWEAATKKGGMVDGIRRAMDEGLVKHIGVTTHDKPENVSRYIDEADWCEAILFTYNILNKSYQDVIAKAHEKGIATIVMNPIGGGILAEGSEVISDAVREGVGIGDAVEAAHRYLKGDSNVDTIICGIAKESDVESTLRNYEKEGFSTEERRRLEESMAKISSEAMGFCTGCGYCMPCPAGINIRAMMNVAYHLNILKCEKRARDLYGWLLNEANAEKSAPAGACLECGQCERKCTQGLRIIEELKRLSAKFDAKE